MFEVFNEYAGDGKIPHSPQGLNPVIGLIGQLALSQGIMLENVLMGKVSIGSCMK